MTAFAAEKATNKRLVTRRKIRRVERALRPLEDGITVGVLRCNIEGFRFRASLC